MQEEYICDDRNVLENIEKIKNMTDEEFTEHLKKLKEKSVIKSQLFVPLEIIENTVAETLEEQLEAEIGENR